MCSIRRIVVSFVKYAKIDYTKWYFIFIFRIFTRLPTLEIVSCSYCEYIIPLNMIYIHKVVYKIIKFLLFIMHFIWRALVAKILPAFRIRRLLPQKNYPQKIVHYNISSFINHYSIILIDGNSTYLKPISLPHPQLQQNFRLNEKSTNQQTRKPSSDGN